MKHAYLIIAHHEFEILERLVSALDDDRNDIYIHFDKKIEKIPDIKSKKARLFKLEKRLDIRWGDVSQITLEFLLFQTAFINGPYAYYHLLSGVDMPLKSQNYIHDFFDQHQGKEFVGYRHKTSLSEIDRKVRRYHFFSRHFQPSNGFSGIFRRFIRFTSLRFQFVFGIRKNKQVDFKKGTSWVSITNDFVKFLIPQYDEVTKMYSCSFCADEIFLHTICWNSQFKEKVFDLNNEERGCQRLILWEDNKVAERKESDFQTLVDSDMLFARKFSSKEITIVKKLSEYIKESRDE